MKTAAVRKQFTSLNQTLYYLDNAATTLKPQAVIERLAKYYAEQNGSPHRGAHRLSILSTQLYDQAKVTVANFVAAGSDDKVVFTRGTTEALNLVAAALPDNFLQKGDNIVITITSHHSNILPWQRLAKRTGAELHYLYCDQSGQIAEAELAKINDCTKVVSLPYVVNGIGAIHPVKEVVKRASAVGALSIVDAAQAVGHIAVNFNDIGCDFLAFSGHKIYGPQGIGVLVAKNGALEKLNPFNLGGDMIEYVTEQSATFAEIPTRFEAGTQNVAGAVGLAAAIDWLAELGFDNVYQHNQLITDQLYAMLVARHDIEVYGPPAGQPRGSLVTFNVKDVHPHDVATILDSCNVAIRAGHHCCQPLMAYLKTQATCRASVGVYNTAEDIAALSFALDKVQEVFA